MYIYKVAVAVASCDHQKSKLRAVAVAEGFWVAELQVRQVKIGRNSSFDTYVEFSVIINKLILPNIIIYLVHNSDE